MASDPICTSASYSALNQSVTKLSATAQALNAQKNLIGQGGNFEEVVLTLLKLKKNMKPETILVNGRSITVVPEHIWTYASRIVEAKTSFGAVKLEQLVGLAALAQREGKPLVYVFFKRPSATELAKMERTLAEEGLPLPAISYLF